MAMQKEEGKFKKDFSEHIENFYNGYCKVTHGNQYQAGIPDCLIQSTGGLFTLVELKFWNVFARPADFHAMQNLMKGAQISVIKHQIWKRNGPCLLVAQLGYELDNCCICYKDKINVVPWKHLAKLLAISSDFDTVLNHVIPN